MQFWAVYGMATAFLVPVPTTFYLRCHLQVDLLLGVQRQVAEVAQLAATHSRLLALAEQYQVRIDKYYSTFWKCFATL